MSKAEKDWNKRTTGVHSRSTHPFHRATFRVDSPFWDEPECWRRYTDQQPHESSTRTWSP
jgi:hypothetical protein